LGLALHVVGFIEVRHNLVPILASKLGLAGEFTGGFVLFLLYESSHDYPVFVGEVFNDTGEGSHTGLDFTVLIVGELLHENVSLSLIHCLDTKVVVDEGGYGVDYNGSDFTELAGRSPLTTSSKSICENAHDEGERSLSVLKLNTGIYLA